MLVVTGAQRSGTRYLARVLARAQYPVTHELGDPFGSPTDAPDPRTNPPRGSIDVSWLAAWFQPEAYIVHLVRQPLKAIVSSVHRGTFTRPRPYGKWAMDKMPEIELYDEPERSARYWLGWTDLADKQAQERLRVESVTARSLAEMLERAGMFVNIERLREAVADTPTTTNGGSLVPSLDYADLGKLANPVQHRAESYGYE